MRAFFAFDWRGRLGMGILMILAANMTMATNWTHDQAEFEFLGQTVDQDFVKLNYRLPFGGVVELRIYTEEGELIWRNQYLNERGENQIRLKTAAFETGNTYAIHLNYKKDAYQLLLEMK